MQAFEKVVNKLKELNIEYELVEHEPAITTKLADKFIEGIEGVRTKTLFLTNRNKKNFYLVIVDEYKRLDIPSFKEMLNEKQIKIASEETLKKVLDLPAGVVSPFGLLNTDNENIQVFIDENIIKEERMSFHPNTNEKTLFINTNDLLKYLKDIAYEANIVRL